MVDEEPRLVVTPILLDNEDLNICKELAYQVECCYIDESIFEIIDEGEPLDSHFASKCDDMQGIHLPFAKMEENEKTCLENFSQEVQMDSVEEDIRYKGASIEEKASWEILGKPSLMLPIPFQKRFLTFEEISFFWYRDGYSENIVNT